MAEEASMKLRESGEPVAGVPVSCDMSGRWLCPELYPGRDGHSIVLCLNTV
jgi:hypothetical protein